MRQIKKQLQKENDWFDKHGVVGFSKSADQISSGLKEFYDNYEQLKNIPELHNKAPEAELNKAEKEYSEFMEIIREYHINLRAASKVGEIFLESAKNNLEQNTRMNNGYNKDGGFISDKKILDNIPSIAFNNKV